VYGESAMDKGERLRLFLKALAADEAANTCDEARDLLESALNEIEDRYSRIPDNPMALTSVSDGRLYPPRDDFERGSTPTYRRFRTKGNIVFFGVNGAIKIETLFGDILLDKPGADGRLIGDL
jgi:hypothetical protein